jgi:hypothetical protein
LIYLFTIACADPVSAGMWSKLFTTERSQCVDGLTSVLEPLSTHDARFEWLDDLAGDISFELAQRQAVLLGFPDYFERLWELSRTGPPHAGNADDGVDRLLPGLWLLWPDLRFVISVRDGIGAVDARTARLQSDDGFRDVCVEWVEKVTRITAGRDWLRKHDADIREVKLEEVLAGGEDLGRVWEPLLGEWEQDEPSARARAAELAPQLPAAASVWERWGPERRAVFNEVCGHAQGQLGYAIPDAIPDA